MILELGSKIKDYHIKELLHDDAGEYREVYKATDDRDGTVVAMIVYTIGKLEERLQLLPILETDMRANLYRPAFAPMTDWGEATLADRQKIEFCIIDYWLLEPVADIRNYNSVLSQEESWKVFCDVIAGANEIAHYAEGACHFNICPSTVSITRDVKGERRGDLNGVQFVSNDFVKNKTIDKHLLDTQYRAPEGYDGPLTPKSMQFSLAVLLATMLQGHHSWMLQGDNKQRSRCRIERLEPQVNVGTALSACLIKAMALNPDDRYATMDEFVDAVMRFCPHPLPDDYVGFSHVQLRKYPSTDAELVAEIGTNLEWLCNTELGLNK